MKKRLSFLPTVVVGVTTLIVLGACAGWLTETFSLPDWAFSAFLLVSVIAYYEVVSRLGPKEIDSPISQLIKLSRKDKVVLFIALLGCIVISRLGIGFQSGWINLLFLILGLGAFKFICSYFGSRDLKETVSFWGQN